MIYAQTSLFDAPSRADVLMSRAERCGFHVRHVVSFGADCLVLWRDGEREEDMLPLVIDEEGPGSVSWELAGWVGQS